MVEREADLTHREKLLQTRETREVSLSPQDGAINANTSISPLNSSFSPTKETPFFSNDLSGLFSPTNNSDGNGDTSEGYSTHDAGMELTSSNTSVNASTFISEYVIDGNPPQSQPRELESFRLTELARQYEELQQQHNVLVSRQDQLEGEKTNLLEELARLQAASDVVTKQAEEMTEITKERDLLRVSLATLQADSLALWTKLQDAQKAAEARIQELENERFALQNECTTLREESLRWKNAAEKSSLERAEQESTEKGKHELQHQNVMSKLTDAEALNSQLHAQVVTLEREVDTKRGQISQLEEKLGEETKIKAEREKEARRVEEVTLKLQEAEEKLQKVEEQSQKAKQSQQLQLQEAQAFEAQRSESETRTKNLQEQVELLVLENRMISSRLEVMSQTQNRTFGEGLRNRQEEIFRQLQQERTFLQSE